MPKIAIDGIIGIDVTTEGIRSQIKAAKREEIDFEISSPGGLVSEGIAIFNLIKNIPQKTTANIIGIAASMSAIIPMAADEVRAESMSFLMIHNSRGITAGDRHDHSKRIAIMSGLDKMFARVFSEKTGKSTEEIGGLMDSETFFFGNEMEKAGFVDKIIESENQEDQEEARAFALLQIENCEEEIKKLAPEDLGKIAAMLKTQPQTQQATEPVTKLRTPEPRKSATNQQSKEVKNMDLTKFLAENLEAKKEFDTLLKAEFEKGADSIEARIDKVSPFLTAEYPEQIKAQGMKAIKGDISTDTFDAIVAMHDMQNEGKNSQAAADETGEQGSTQSQDHEAISEGGEIKTEADRQAMVARLKKSQGGYKS